ncbi:MAG: guanylyl cyclase [Cyclobacteriaceae bacterium]|nr:MAG: guanylyl cyclase [Cyclobacteriaceae bacterium]
MFADIVGYTSMMQEDESLAIQARDRHRKVIREQVLNHSGEIVQYYGDGALIIFPSAKESVMAAIEIQQHLRQDPKVPLRIGIHLGDIVQDKEGVFGDGVNIASRIESMGVAGTILFSDRVFQEIANHPSIRAISLGVFQLKNVKIPVEIYALNEEGIEIPGTSDLNYAKSKSISKSIAIMPFTNMIDSDKPDYFADGVSEEIINGLSKVEGINVISRSTCQAILQSEEDILAVGRRLKVFYFLEGSVRRVGDRVRVSVRLINTDDGFQLWAESYDRNLNDIFEVQDEIARRIINGLKISFDIPVQEETIVARATESMEAYTQHLKGLHHLKKENPDEVKKAIEHFQNALKIDPGFTSAECALSRSFSYLGSCGGLPPVSAYAKALKCVMTAIEKNGDSAEAHLAMADIKFYHFWDWQGARESLEKAVALGLNSSELHQSYGLYYAAVGKPAQGIPKMLKALELNPLSVPVMIMLGTLYLFDEQFGSAVAVFNEILELEPGYRKAHQFKGMALGCMNAHQEALQEFEIYHKAVNHPQKAITGLIISHHHLGNKQMSDELMSRLYDRLKKDYSAAVEIDIAISHAGIGDYETAVDFLENVFEKRLSIACMGMIWVMRCPCFKELWKHPGYKNLLDNIGIV